MSRGPRTRLRAGISSDRHGLSGRVKVRGIARERRFPHGTPLDEVQAWIDRTRAILEHDTPRTPRGTLGRDAETYYLSVKDLVGFVSRRAEIRAWVQALRATTRRAAITQADVRRVRGDWLAAGVAPKTINNRVFSLQHLYRTIDGPQYPTPCDGLPPLTVHKRPAQVIPVDIVRQIEANMRESEQKGLLRDSKTRARYMVFAATGKRPSEIGRAEPGDVDLERRVWIPRDGKGGFCAGVYLNDDMLAAWQVFIAAEAWGYFDSGSFTKRIRNHGFPAHAAPYQLRHTVGITMSEAGIDLKDIGNHLGHKRTETTAKHYVPVLNSRIQKASESLAPRQLGWNAAGTKAGKAQKS